MGINDHLYDPAQHHLLTAASCTTNCLAPVVKVIHEGLGIKHGVTAEGQLKGVLGYEERPLDEILLTMIKSR